MESLPPDDFFKFNSNTLQEVRKTYNLDQPGAMSDAIDILEEWLKKQEHFIKKDFDRNYLERTIIRAKGSVECAKQRLDKLCTARKLTPTFFVNCKINEFTHLELVEEVYLPKPTSDNYRVYLLRNRVQDFVPEILPNCYRRGLQFLQYQYSKDYTNGMIAVLDYRETNLVSFLKHFDLNDLQSAIHISLECFGIRMKGIHMLSNSKFIEMVVGIFKQILSEKLGSRIHVHKTLESLHEYVEKDVLPADYGGADKTMTEIFKDFVNVVDTKEFIEYLKMMNGAGTNEAYRRTDKYNEENLGIAGTFRALKVD